MKSFSLILGLFFVFVSISSIFADDNTFKTSLLAGSGYQETKNEILSPLVYSGKPFNMVLESGYYGKVFTSHNALNISSGSLESSKTDTYGTKMSFNKLSVAISGLYNVAEVLTSMNIYTGSFLEAYGTFYSIKGRMPGASKFSTYYGDVSFSPAVLVTVNPLPDISLRFIGFFSLFAYSIHPEWNNHAKNVYRGGDEKISFSDGTFETIHSFSRIHIESQCSYRIFSHLDVVAEYVLTYEHNSFSDSVTTIDNQILAGICLGF